MALRAQIMRMEGIHLRDARHVGDKARADRSPGSDQISVRNALPHQLLGNDVHHREAVGDNGIQFLLQPVLNNLRQVFPVDLVCLVIAQTRQRLIRIGDDRRAFVRTDRTEAFDPVRDQVRVGDDDLFCLLLAEILELPQHLLRRAQIQGRLLFAVLKVRHQDLSVDGILRIQEMHITGGRDRFAVLFSQLHDRPVVILQVLDRLRFIFQGAVLVISGHGQELVVPERLDLKIIVVVHQLFQLAHGSASLDRLEYLSRLTGGTDDQTFPVRAQEASRKKRPSAEHVFQVGLGDTAVQIHPPGLILRKQNNVIIVQMADLFLGASAGVVDLFEPGKAAVGKH